MLYQLRTQAQGALKQHSLKSSDAEDSSLRPCRIPEVSKGLLMIAGTTSVQQSAVISSSEDEDEPEFVSPLSSEGILDFDFGPEAETSWASMMAEVKSASWSGMQEFIHS